MEKRETLAAVAETLALRPFHGDTMGLKSNLKAITDHFGGRRSEFEGLWCAAFVYHCCVLAGFDIPPRYPSRVFGSFAGVPAWLGWAKLPCNRFYYSARNSGFSPARGDIVIYDHVFVPSPHDHVGVVLQVTDHRIRAAEGNVNNLSAVVERDRDHHIRGYVRIPDD